MTSQNAIIGDQDPTVSDTPVAPLPQADAEDGQMKELMKTAKFAKSGEYKQLKGYFEDRIGFYQKYLPDGRAVATGGAVTESGVDGLTLEELGKMWIVSNVIIGEFKAIMNVYEQAAQYVKDAASQR